MNEAARAHERGLDPARRKRDGVFYTPAPLVRRLVDDALGRVLAAAPAGATVRVVDPACGAGAFLIAAAAALLARDEEMARETGEARSAGERLALLQAAIFGVDVDPAAALLARAAVAGLVGAVPEDMSENIKVGNALLGAGAPAAAGQPFVWAEEFPAALAAGGFDAVLGNPPFVDAEAMTRHHAALRRHCAGCYEAARGNWDLFCVFIELGLRLCAPGGYVALVVPNKLASADYAAATRRLLTREARLVALYDLSEALPFAAGVYPLAFVARRGPGEATPVALRRGTDECEEMSLGTGLAEGPWPISGRGDAACVAHMRAVGRPLGELAQVWGAATVGEAYAIAELIVEGEAGLRVVNSGTIDRCAELWGKTPLRYLGRSFLRPVIAAPERLPPRRLAQARTPKLIVAGMTRSIEATIDARGEVLAGKSTTICWWPDDLRVLAAIVHSRVIDDYYQHVHGGDRLARGYLRIGPRQLRGLPVPAPEDWDREVAAEIVRLVDRWRAGDPSVAPALDALVDSLYGLA